MSFEISFSFWKLFLSEIFQGDFSETPVLAGEILLDRTVVFLEGRHLYSLEGLAEPNDWLGDTSSFRPIFCLEEFPFSPLLIAMDQQSSNYLETFWPCLLKNLTIAADLATVHIMATTDQI